MEQKFTFRGHTFENEQQLIAAKKEAEAVEYLREKADFDSAEGLMRLYNRILDRDMMETVIGIEFLKEIRTKLLASELFKPEQIRPLPLLPEAKRMKKRREVEKRTRDQLLADYLKRQNTILKIVCGFLSILVIAMIAITLTGKRSPLAVRYETQILDKYASWAEELQRQENNLREYLILLEKEGIEVPPYMKTDAGLTEKSSGEEE